MSKELSRVKTRQKKLKAEKPAAAPKPHDIHAGTLTRSRRSSTISSKSKDVQADGKSLPDGEWTPSRTHTYTSERVRLSKLFVNSLIFIFVILLGSLLLWGLNGAPELRTILW